MRYFILAVLSGCIMACGSENKKVSVSDTTVTTVSAVTPLCTEEQAIMAISRLPDVVAQQAYLDSLTNHKRGVNYLTDTAILDHQEYWMIRVGYISEIRRENYWDFYVNKSNCADIRVLDPVEGTILPVDVKTTLESPKPVIAKPVQLPFKFTEYLDADFTKESMQAYSATHPSYAMLNDTKLETLIRKVDTTATMYFLLPGTGAYKAYVIQFLDEPVTRYCLVTVANDKIVDKVKIGQTDDTDTHMHFVVEKGNVVKTYEHIDEEEESTLLHTYHIGPDGHVK